MLLTKNKNSLRAKKWAKDNPEKFKENQRRYKEKHFDRDREKRNESSRIWRKNNPEKVRKLNRKYCRNNKEKVNKYAREYYENNKEKLRKMGRESYQRNKKNNIRLAKKRVKKCLESWIRYLPTKAKCEICEKILFLKGTSSSNTIHFDHKTRNCAIKCNPSSFLRQKFNTEENRKIWESCDFGILCNKCNLILITDNRVAWLRNALRYATRQTKSKNG